MTHPDDPRDPLHAHDEPPHDDPLRDDSPRDDPPRLVDDLDAPSSLRALLDETDALTPPPLSDDVRSRTRTAVLTRAAPSRTPRLAVSIALAVAAAALLWLLDRSVDPLHGEPDPSRPAIVGELDAARTPDASPADAPHLDVGPAPPREHDRVPWLEVNGDGCGLDVRVWLGALDDDVVSVALVLDEVDVALDDGALDDGLLDTDCEGTIARELDAELFRRAGAVPNDLWLPLSLGAPEVRCGGTYTVTACVRDGLGRLSTTLEPSARAWRTRDVEENRFVGRIETPSGPASPSDLARGDVVTGYFVRTSPPWTTPGPRTPTFVEASVRRAVSIPSEGDARNHETTLELDDGRAISVPADTRVGTSARGYVLASSLTIGEAVLVLDRGQVHERHVREVSTIDHAASAAVPHPWPVHRMLDVSFPDAYFVDGLLVHDVGADDEPEPSVLVPVSMAEEPIRAMPDPSWDCSLSSSVVVDAWPDDAASVALVYAPHRGRGGARRALACDDGHLGLELPRALLEVTPPGPDGARVLSAQVPGWDDEGRDWHALHALDDDVDASRPTPASVACSSAYDVLACVRGADGTLTSSPGVDARWTRTGPACFARGTAVSTSRGELPIESLRVGDRVTSREPATGERREVRVRALIPRGIRAIREMTLASGRVLRVTDEHPLLDARTSTFRAASRFEVGDRLVDPDGRAIEILAITQGASTSVFDLSVEAPHTFVAEGVVVHNY